MTKNYQYIPYINNTCKAGELLTIFIRKDFDTISRAGLKEAKDDFNSQTTDGVYIYYGSWNDYGYYTHCTLFILNNEFRSESFSIKIASKQTQRITGSDLPLKRSALEEASEQHGPTLDQLPDGFYSIGNEFYYRNLHEYHNSDSLDKEFILEILNDISLDLNLLDEIKTQNPGVFEFSFMRDVPSENLIRGYYHRLCTLRKGASAKEAQTTLDFKIHFDSEKSPYVGDISFKTTESNIKKYTNANIISLIGANGSGKTRLLEDIFLGEFSELSFPNESTKTSRLSNYFYISFSPFQNKEIISRISTNDSSSSEVINNLYLGIYSIPKADLEYGEHEKYTNDPDIRKNISEFISPHLQLLLWMKDDRFKLWIESIENITPDFFENLNILDSIDDSDLTFDKILQPLEKNLSIQSSGNLTCIATLTGLISMMSDSSLLLFDEPENYLHPPLLAKFIESIGKICTVKNSVAILATHSPVVLQETLSQNVWLLERLDSGKVSVSNPSLKTYGENTGKINREIFRLESINSGFYKRIKEFIKDKNSYDGLEYIRIRDELIQELGVEGQMIFASLEIE